MVKFGVDDVAEAMRLGQEAAAASLQKGCRHKVSLANQHFKINRGHGERDLHQTNQAGI